MKNLIARDSLRNFFSIGLQISPYEKLSKLRSESVVPLFFANFCHEIGCENDQTYIFRFVKYLSTFFYTYLPQLANINPYKATGPDNIMPRVLKELAIEIPQ
jgi:hypothetical protein